MRANRIIPNLGVADIQAAKPFYTGYLDWPPRNSTWDGWPGTPHRTPEPTSSW